MRRTSRWQMDKVRTSVALRYLWLRFRRPTNDRLDAGHVPADRRQYLTSHHVLLLRFTADHLRIVHGQYVSLCRERIAILVRASCFSHRHSGVRLSAATDVHVPGAPMFGRPQVSRACSGC
jgi:hypothetical protein